MKKQIILLAIFLTSITTFAIIPPTTYNCVVKFNSQCCGVPDAAPLFNCIALFKKKNKIKKIVYYLISPMGREGEYYMAFPLTELTKKQIVFFIKQVNATTLKMKDKGNATTEQNMAIDQSSLSSRTSITKKTI